jgi:hypothetical protein
MYCPKCREEFREGFTFCERCNENLVDHLPPETKSTELAKPKTLVEAKKTFCIEKWLKRGAVVFVIIGILSDITDLFVRIHMPAPFDNSSHPGPGWVLARIIDFCSSVVGSFLWGAFFYGFGRIIEILKEGFADEKQ